MLDGVVEKTKKGNGGRKTWRNNKKMVDENFGNEIHYAMCYQTELILNGRKFRSIHVLNELKSVWHACYQLSNFHDLRVLPFF